MKKFILAMFVLAPLIIGCASTKPVTIRTHLPPPGTVGVAPTTTVVAPQQYRSAPPTEEDPFVLYARAIARQNNKDREIWKAACFELRRIDMYMTYEDCRRILGDERYIGGYYGYGRSVGGSVIGNSSGRVRWK